MCDLTDTELQVVKDIFGCVLDIFGPDQIGHYAEVEDIYDKLRQRKD